MPIKSIANTMSRRCFIWTSACGTAGYAVVKKFGGKAHQVSDKAEAMPELKQDPKNRNCTPITYANAILWLADHGYPNLVQGVTSSLKVRKDLVEELTHYMRTNNVGTSHSDEHKGLAEFIASRGYKVEIEYCGRQEKNSCGRFQSLEPSLDFIAEGVNGSSNVILSLNEYDLKQKRYTLSHSVTVADVNRLDSSRLDLKVSDSLGYFKRLRLSGAKDQSIIKLLHARGYNGVSQYLKCEQLDDRSRKYLGRILFVSNVTRFKVIN